MNTVGPDGGPFCIIPDAFPILNRQLIEVRDKIVERCNSKSEMNVDVVRHGFRGAGNDVKLIVSTYAEPDVSSILKRFGYPLQPKHLFIKIGALLQVTHVYRGVVELRRTASQPRLREGQRGIKKRQKQKRKCDLPHAGMLQHTISTPVSR